jgi:DNA adenine methylase
VPAEAHCFVEVFAGSAALTLAKERHPIEVLNDLNGDLVALMRNAHFHLPALLDEMRWFVASRKDLHDFRAQPGLTELQRAARFLLRNRISFGGGGTSFGVAKQASGIGFDRDDVGERLEGIRRRLNKVVVENLPYDRCLQTYDADSTFFFLDPPYVGPATGAYEGWSQRDMTQFRTQLDRLKGGWLVTVNDSPENRALFSDCKVRTGHHRQPPAEQPHHDERHLRRTPHHP